MPGHDPQLFTGLFLPAKTPPAILREVYQGIAKEAR